MSSTSLPITGIPRGHSVTVRVHGRLDRAGIARLRTEIAGWRQAGVLELRLDLSGVADAHPGLARALAWAGTQWRGRGASLIVTGASAALTAQLRTEVAAVQSVPGSHRDRPAARIYRPETAEQP